MGGATPRRTLRSERGIQMWSEGADIIDVGGESTRPGAEPVSIDEELGRVVPVVAGLVSEGVMVSVDTRKAAVAAAAIGAGAHIVNDVTALGDTAMAAASAQSGVGVVLMHMQGSPQTMQLNPEYEDVVSEVFSYLVDRAEYARAAGIDRANICLDPGIGFGKTHDHNLELLSKIDRFTHSEYPILVGASRKGLLGTILHDAGLDTVPAERDPATAATVALAIASGAAVVRVHNVGHAFQTARVADAIVRASQRRL